MHCVITDSGITGVSEVLHCQQCGVKSPESTAVVAVAMTVVAVNIFQLLSSFVYCNGVLAFRCTEIICLVYTYLFFFFFLQNE